MTTATHNVPTKTFDSNVFELNQSTLLQKLTFVKDSYLNLECLELNFHNDDEQAAFLAIEEKLLPENSQISCHINNPHFKQADYLVITKKDNDIHYQVYVTFKRQSWYATMPLESFGETFINQLNEKDCYSKLELIESFGIYVSVHFVFDVNQSISCRIKQLSSVIGDVTNKVL